MTTSAFCVNSLINGGDNVTAAALKGADLHSSIIHGSSKCSLTPKFADTTIQGAASVVTATSGNGLATTPQVSTAANMYHLQAEQNASYASPWFYPADHHPYSTMPVPMSAVADDFDNSAYSYAMGAPKNFETGLMAASGGGFYSIGRHQAYDRYPTHANSMYHHPAAAVSHAGPLPVSLTAAGTLATKYITSDGGGGGNTSPHATTHTLLEEKHKYSISAGYDGYSCPKETLAIAKSSGQRTVEISPTYPSTGSAGGSPITVIHSKDSPGSDTKENDVIDDCDGKILFSYFSLLYGREVKNINNFLINFELKNLIKILITCRRNNEETG